MKRTLAIAFVLLLMSCVALAQTTPAASSKGSQSKQAAPAKPRPSPAGTADFTFADGKKITINYSRPHTKDPKTGEARKIYGGLVPYDKVWRTGANEATSLKTDVDLDIGGTKIPAGSYTLYTLPSAGTWKLIINKQTGQWGTEYDESKDLARVDMKSSPLSSPAEQFTISFDKAGDGANLNLDWENTRQSVTVKEAK
jgi:hypothetical protein